MFGLSPILSNQVFADEGANGAELSVFKGIDGNGGRVHMEEESLEAVADLMFMAFVFGMFALDSW